MLDSRSNGEAVRTWGLRRDFGSLVALRDLNISIPRGIIYGLIGPNGSGKTTAIKILVGLLKPTDGRAEVLGERVPIKALLARVGYMPQEMAVYQDLTVRENVELFGRLYGLTNNPLRQQERALLQMTDLTDRQDTIVAHLSGGMKHRVSLVCALLHSPELVFLDEPTVGVDPELRVGFWEYFTRLKSEGRTIVMTTHYMDEAERCDVVGMIRQGQLIAEGSPSTIKASTHAASLEEAFLTVAGRQAK